MSIFVSVCYSPVNSLITAMDTHANVLAYSSESGAVCSTLSLKQDCFLENIAKEKVVMQFIDDSRLIVFLAGRIHIVAVSVDGVMGLSLLGTVSAPPGSICLESGAFGFLIGTDSGVLYQTDYSGKIVSYFSIGDEIRCIKFVKLGRVLVGSKSGCVKLVDFESRREISKLKISSPIEYITVDSASNWFAAISSLPNQRSSVLCGSTRSLTHFFQSKPLSLLNRLLFAPVNGGLSILASSPTPTLFCMPLDLSACVPKLELEALDAVFDMHVINAQSIVCAGRRLAVVDTNTVKELVTI